MSKIELNQKAPVFEVEDYLGNKISLLDYQGSHNVLLVFNRGFVWPFCQKHMMQLHLDKNEFDKRNTIIVIVGPENKETFNKFFSSNKYTFVGIPDAKNSILKTYGQEINIFKLGRMPAQVLIDKAGFARFVYYGHSMSDIPENKDVLRIIDEI